MSYLNEREEAILISSDWTFLDVVIPPLLAAFSLFASAASSAVDSVGVIKDPQLSTGSASCKDHGTVSILRYQAVCRVHLLKGSRDSVSDLRCQTIYRVDLQGTKTVLVIMVIMQSLTLFVGLTDSIFSSEGAFTSSGSSQGILLSCPNAPM